MSAESGDELKKGMKSVIQAEMCQTHQTAWQQILKVSCDWFRTVYFTCFKSDTMVIFTNNVQAAWQRTKMESGK